MVRWFLVLALAAASPAPGQSIDTILTAAAERDAASRCGAAQAGEIIVCGDPDRDRRYRLPFPTGRDPVENGAVAGEVPPPRIDSPYRSGCGIFAGQRGNCTKREMRAHGYGGGRDPLTLIGRLVTKVVDGDAEVGPPAKAPPRPRD